MCGKGDRPITAATDVPGGPVLAGDHRRRDRSIFYSCQKGAVLGAVALLALHSNVLVMHLDRAPTAGHPAMVVVKKERARKQ